MSEREKNDMMKKLGATSSNAFAELAEHPAQLQLELQTSLTSQSVSLPNSTPTSSLLPAPKATISASQGDATLSLSSASMPAPATPVIQTESRLPTGKRRITPQFLGFVYYV